MLLSYNIFAKASSVSEKKPAGASNKVKWSNVRCSKRKCGVEGFWAEDLDKCQAWVPIWTV